jgi:hypothetical protein
MKYIKRIVEITVYVVVGLFFGSIFFRELIFSRFDSLLGDVGDARFNGIIQEHWWQVINGSAKWLSPVFFSPTKGVLGHSDAGFLNAPLYIILRFCGLDNFTSYQIVLLVLVALGWIGMIFFLRVCLKSGLLPTIIGTILFIFPNAMANSIGHTQLLSIYLIPYLAIGIYFFIPNIKKSTFCGTAAGIFLAVFIPAIFYTSYYVGWFLMFFILLLAAVFCTLSMISLGSRVVWKHIIWKRKNINIFMPYFIICVISFIPFLLTYIPIALTFGSRSYYDAASMLPTFIDYINVGPNNWLWGNILYSIFPDIGTRPMAHELIKGVPVFFILTYLGILIFYVSKVKNYKLALFKDDSCRLFFKGNEAQEPAKLGILCASLSIAILLSWGIIFKIYGCSLWWLVLKTIPGASGIRAVYRFQHILAFPLAILIAIGLHQFINYTNKPVHSYLKRSVFLVISTIFCLMLIGEQFNTGDFANYSKQQQRNMLAEINPPPQQAKIFALLPDKTGTRIHYKAQIDAILIAQKYGLYTINGYSGQFPIGWDGIFYYNRSSYMLFLIRWIKNHKLMTDKLYFLDINTGKWHSSMNLLASFKDIQTRIDKTSFSKDTFSQVGCVSKDSITSTGKSGFLLFGPYIPMDAGQYRFILKGKGPSVNNAWADIVSKKGKITHYKFNLNRTSENSDTLVDETVTLDDDIDDIEVRVYVDKKDDILIKSYKLIPIKKKE